MQGPKSMEIIIIYLNKESKATLLINRGKNIRLVSLDLFLFFFLIFPSYFYFFLQITPTTVIVLMCVVHAAAVLS